MSRRNTTTGRVLEDMVVPALEHGGCSYKTQADIGKRPGGSRHKVDILAERSKSKFLISLKWQQVSGTAEQKVPFEAICLIDIMRKEECEKAYLVLGGNGWSLRDFTLTADLTRTSRISSWCR